MKKIILGLAISLLAIGSVFADSIAIRITDPGIAWHPVFITNDGRALPNLCVTSNSSGFSCGTIPSKIFFPVNQSKQIFLKVGDTIIMTLDTSYNIQRAGECNYIITLNYNRLSVNNQNIDYCRYSIFQ